MQRLVLSLGVVVLAVLAAACSSSSPAVPDGTAPPPASAPAGGTIVVVAKDLVFSTASISAPAGEAFQITLDNQESVPHNIAIKDASGAVGFKGEIVTSRQVTYDIPALGAGTYEFFCEVHPNMKGTLTAG
jgi:plastocyanin